VALIGWRLIPAREDATVRGKDIAQYVAELTVPADNKQIGRRLGELTETAEKTDVAIIGLIRKGTRLYGQAQNAILQEGDAIVLEAAPEALDEFRSALSLAFSDERREELLKTDSEGLDLIEIVIPPESRINGKTAQTIGLAWRQRAVVMGISRQGRRITQQVRKTIVRPGDILLILVQKDTGPDVANWLGALPLADRGLAVTNDSKTWAAIGLFAAAVAAASIGLIYLPIALGLVVIAYVLTRILPLQELYDHIEWPVVVLLGSMIPLGAALENSGGTELIANALISLTGDWPAWAGLTTLMLMTMTLSDVLNNTATTIVAAPVGIQMANTLGVSPDPFLMAVAVAASSAFLTPIGHKNNTLLLGPGGYHFGDYWRIGLPLEILVVAVSIPAILAFWPL
jgi:di/tricarboxylate transporter